MKKSFQIIESKKSGLDSREGYIVTRNRTSFLRILGSEPEWALITATASEDDGRIKVCVDQLRLIESALRLGAELDTKPSVETDWLGREYVKICIITREQVQTDEVFDSENESLFSRFFEIYDEHRNLDARDSSEMRELYDVLAIDDQGGDVYLSDGVWLSSNGAFHVGNSTASHSAPAVSMSKSAS